MKLAVVYGFISILGGQFMVKAFTISTSCDVCRKTPLFARDDQYLNDLRQEREKELLELGGDPFFLTDDDLLEGEISDEVEDDSSMPSMSLLGAMSAGGGVANMMGAAEAEDEAQDVPSEPEFEWDGESDDSAYFD